MKRVLVGGDMSATQFEMIREQLKKLSLTQLLALQGEISNELACTDKQLVTEEEAELIYSLFT
jgi:hypothetical protein